MLFVLFFLSGISGLIYQVVWVRQFGNVFGNTIHSTSLVVAIFMLGLGAGSYVVGTWADRRYLQARESLLRAYGGAELVIAALGLSISLVLPHLASLSAMSSSYVADTSSGWFVLSRMSYVAQGAIAVVLVAPIAMLMGGTLTLLIRHRVRHDVESAGGWKIAMLYAVNTAGGAAGAFLTDFFLVPASGLRATQMVAVALNVFAGAGALVLARRATSPIPARKASSRPGRVKIAPSSAASSAEVTTERPHAARWTAAALAVSGLAAMGMEMVWLRHFSLLLGGFRAVFSLVLTIMLVGIGAGSSAGGLPWIRISRKVGAIWRPP